MATTWDILHVKSLEVEHSVPDSEVRLALKEGRLSRDDCVRKPGDDRWWRIYEVTEFRSAGVEADRGVSKGSPGAAPEREPPILDEAPRIDEGSLRDMLKDAEPADARRPARPAAPTPPLAPPTPLARIKPPGAAPVSPIAAAADVPSAVPVAAPVGESVLGSVIVEPEEGLPYRKRHREEAEELDMTPMVDVAMQLILFFMVTSTMIMQMCMEFPKPAPEDGRPQARETVQKLDDLKTDHIMVAVKSEKAGDMVYVDEEKTPTRVSDLSTKIATVKRERAVNGGVVVSAEDAVFHETVVAVVDSANFANAKPIKMAAVKKSSKKATPKKKAVQND